MTQNQRAMMKNSRRVLRRQLAVAMKREGASFREVAAVFGVPVGTVKTWCARAAARAAAPPFAMDEGALARPFAMVCHGLPEPEMKPPMKPPAAQREEAEMKPALKPPAAEAGPKRCRGVTRYDLPGKSLMEQSANFRNLMKGTYPPKCWKIPSWLEGEKLIEAIKAANAAKGRKRGKAEN